MAKDKFFRVQIDKSGSKPRVSTTRTAPKSGRSSEAEKPLEFSPTLDGDRFKRAYIWEYRFAQRSQTRRISKYIPSSLFDRNGVWRKQAQKLRALGIDPIVYLRVVMEHLRGTVFFTDVGHVAQARANAKRAKRALSSDPESAKAQVVYTNQVFWGDDRPPTPAQITSPKYMRIYRRCLQQGERVARMERESEVSIVRSKWCYFSRFGGLPETACAINSMYADSVTPLFRCCFASSLIKIPEAKENMAFNDLMRKTINQNLEQACIQFLRNEAGYRKAWGKRIPPTLIREALSLYEEHIATIEL